MSAPWKKSFDKPRQYNKKQRYYFANKGRLVKAMVFPVVMYGCESCERLLLLNHDAGILGPPEKKNSIQGQRQGLIAQSFCVTKFY